MQKEFQTTSNFSILTLSQQEIPRIQELHHFQEFTEFRHLEEFEDLHHLEEFEELHHFQEFQEFHSCREKNENRHLDFFGTFHFLKIRVTA